MLLGEADAVALKACLEAKLEPICDADPAVLAEYVIALLKHDKNQQDLKTTIANELDDFLKESTKNFVAELFDLLSSKTYLKSPVTTHAAPVKPPSPVTNAVNTNQQPPAHLSNEPGHGTKHSARELSNEDDDDRNFKRSRKDGQPFPPSQSAVNGPGGVSRGEIFLGPEGRNPPHLSQQQLHPPHPAHQNGGAHENGGNVGLEGGDDPRFQKRRRSNEYVDERGGKHFRGGEGFVGGVDGGMRDRRAVGPVGGGPGGRPHEFTRGRGGMRPRGGFGGGPGPYPGGNYFPGDQERWENPDWMHPVHSGVERDMELGGRIPQGNGRFMGLGGRGMERGRESVHSRLGNFADSRGRRPRCRDYDEQGFCLRGEQCPYDHGIDRIVMDSTIIGRTPYEVLPMNPGIRPPTLQQIQQMQAMQSMRQFPLAGSLYGANLLAQQVQAANMDLSRQDGFDPEQLSPVRVPSASHGPSATVDADSQIDDSQKRDLTKPIVDGGAVDTDASSGIGSSGMTVRPGGRGRGAPRGGTFRGGRGGRVGGNVHRGKSDTIVVENIPEEHCTLDKVNEFFKKFGVITNIQIQQRYRKAVVQYGSPAEAAAAWGSPDAIFSNRFVKVYFLDPESDSNLTATSSSTDTPAATGAVNAAETKSGVLAPAVPTTVTAPSETKLKIEEKKKQLRTMMELQKQKELLIKKQIEYQKEIMEKLEKKKLSAKEKAELLSALKTAEEATRTTISSAVQSSAAVKASVPVKLTPEELERQRLDREMDLFNKLQESSAVAAESKDVDPALKAQLEQLQAEARSLGVDTSAVTRGGRGRGRGSWRGVARGGARVFNLDNRTTKFSIQGVTPDNRDVVTAQLEESGPLTSFTFNSAELVAVAQFQSRRDAEMALLKGVKLAGKALTLAWVTDNHTKNEVEPGVQAEPAFATIAQENAHLDELYDEEEDEDEHERGLVTKMSFALPSLPASKIKRAPEPVPADVQIQPSVESKQPEPQRERQSHQPEGQKPPKEKSTALPPPPPLNYNTPDWSASTKARFYIEVLKNGVILETLELEKPTTVFGRLPLCDVMMEHASVSRYHAVLQSREDDKVFLYDLGSAHGTFVNKTVIAPRMFIPLKVGDMIRFGQSTRVYILGGPEEAPPEPVKPVLKKQTQPVPTNESQDTGATWGFAEDAVDEDETRTQRELLDPNGEDGDGDGVPDNAYYESDPKKALRVWCENRGQAMEFSIEEEGHGISKVYVAKVELSIDGSYTITGTGRGSRKKEAEKNSALDACIRLDRQKMLRSSGSGSRGGDVKRRKQKFDDDDEDSFYDRTAADKKKRQKVEPGKAKSETFESLSAKLKAKDEVRAALRSLEEEEVAHARDQEDADDDLDELLQNLNQKSSKSKRQSLEKNLSVLEKEAAQLMKLVKITTPHAMLGGGVWKSKEEGKNASTGTEIPPAVKSGPVAKAPEDQPSNRQEGAPGKRKVTVDWDEDKNEDKLVKKQALGNLMPPPASMPLKNGPQHQTLPEKEKVSEVRDLKPAATSMKSEIVDAGEPSNEAKKKTGKRRVFQAMTQSQVAAHESWEDGEDMVDATVGGGKVDTDAMNKYGY
ncbi:hypothetical protein HDU76_004639 [Blyttiomyces sp. JEL0837]|nr:hypothetical protein HDU76_004639 [Blyttiomyces sp. JEL0837]